jgi:CHAT domain-containing protein
MAALHDGQKFLVENYAVTNSLGLNIRTKQANSDVKKALVFGLTEGTERFAPLPYVKQEIEKLGELVDEEQFLNDKFSYQNFKQQIESSKSSIVHIATHGQFGGTLENTFLQAYKNQISLNELGITLSSHNTSFPNDPIQLLVLSACDTAASNTRATLGMSGVAVKAGVSNVLGSLWSINDQQIVSLVDGFYSNWIKAGLSKSEALRQAQLDLIKSPNYHPSNWASMLLIEG